MALIKCPHCGSSISEHAKKCPHCGAPTTPTYRNVSKSKRSKTWLWVSVAAILILVAGAVVFFLEKNVGKESVFSSIVVSVSTNDKDTTIEITPEFSEKVRQYEIVQSFSEGRAAVRKDGKWGYIDTKGELVIPAIYTAWPEARNFSDGLAFVENEETKAYIDVNGNVVITLNKDDIGSDFVNNRAVIYSAHENKDWTFSLSKTFHIINKKGETISEIPIPNGANLIGDGIGGAYPEVVAINETGFVVPVEYSFCLIDFKGNNLGKLDSDGFGNIPKEPSDFSYVVFEEERGNKDSGYVTLQGIKDKQGNIVVEAKEWSFPDAKYHSESGKRYINPSQGLFVVELYESPFYLNDIDDMRVGDEAEDASYYGFVNLKGENTFSKERWERQTIQTHNKLNNIQRSLY
ncbi:MAG: WG repeat-containing protein [Bacteroides sp.]|nr:WG repeat-containing protein [Bacteroides sp.]MCM1413877.1 WG repeat-containing protein [Bacteroides sp.]